MKPEQANRYGAKALCSECGAVSYHDWKNTDGRELGSHLRRELNEVGGRRYLSRHWRLVRCSNCERGAVVEFLDDSPIAGPLLIDLVPRGRSVAAIPNGVPAGALKEYREAEKCASVGAFRSASAMVRSTLEKTLKANGYTAGNLKARIDSAAADGVITDARKQKAHADIRVLGNEVVHDDWRAIDEGEVDAALHYAQRVLEDLYDDRPTVEAILKAKGRIT